MATKSISQIKIGNDYYNLIDANAVHSTGTLPIENGGTGADTVAGAVVNIVDGQHIKPQQISAVSHIYTMNGNVGTGEGNVYTLHGDIRTYDGDVVIKDVSGTDLHKLSEKAEADHKHSASHIIDGVLPVPRGGTGVSVWKRGQILVSDLYRDGIDFVTPAPGALYISPITDSPQFGTLPVAQGGTGQKASVPTTTVADIASAGENCSIERATFWQWGKIGQLYMAIKTTKARTSSDEDKDDDILAMLKPSKVPCVTSPLINLTNTSLNCAAYNDGTVKVKGDMPANTTIDVIGIYILK